MAITERVTAGEAMIGAERAAGANTPEVVEMAPVDTHGAAKGEAMMPALTVATARAAKTASTWWR